MSEETDWSGPGAQFNRMQARLPVATLLGHSTAPAHLRAQGARKAFLLGIPGMIGGAMAGDMLATRLGASDQGQHVGAGIGSLAGRAAAGIYAGRSLRKKERERGEGSDKQAAFDAGVIDAMEKCALSEEKVKAVGEARQKQLLDAMGGKGDLSRAAAKHERHGDLSWNRLMRQTGNRGETRKPVSFSEAKAKYDKAGEEGVAKFRASNPRKTGLLESATKHKGKIGLGLAGAGAAAYGIHKLRQRKKRQQEQQG